MNQTSTRVIRRWRAIMAWRSCRHVLANHGTRPRWRPVCSWLSTGSWRVCATTFFTLSELSQAIQTLLERLNNRPFKKLPGSRRSLFEQLDRPALRPLPVTPHEVAEWKKVRVCVFHIDYHVEVDSHYYEAATQQVADLMARVGTPTADMKTAATGKRRSKATA